MLAVIAFLKLVCIHIIYSDIYILIVTFLLYCSFYLFGLQGGDLEEVNIFPAE